MANMLRHNKQKGLLPKPTLTIHPKKQQQISPPNNPRNHAAPYMAAPAIFLNNFQFTANAPTPYPTTSSACATNYSLFAPTPTAIATIMNRNDNNNNSTVSNAAVYNASAADASVVRVATASTK